MTTTEAQLQIQVANYLRKNYPDVLFYSDFGSGIKLTKGQAVRQKRQNGGRRAWPDMFIAEPAIKCVDGSYKYEWHGLFLELKREGTRLKKKNGEWATPHIAEQAKMLEGLQKWGYLARFGCGFAETKAILDAYLNN